MYGFGTFILGFARMVLWATTQLAFDGYDSHSLDSGERFFGQRPFSPPIFPQVVKL
jgi:hypothetical protein